MTYIDPKTYNYKELKGEDEIIMRGYNYCIEDVKTACENIIDILSSEFSASPTVEKLSHEICENFSKELNKWMNMNRTELTCSLMESSEEYLESE